VAKSPSRTQRDDGVIEWHDADGRLHRADGPARVFASGRQEWYRHGRRHRDDGPAASYPDGRRIWFENGERIRTAKV
jgi:hypothetical protein